MSAFQSFGSAFGSGNRGRPARCWITPLDAFNNDEVMNDLARSFQYFPESISESKANSYQSKEIPGLSHPLYQWTAGGPRELSFTAVFSADLPPEDARGNVRSSEVVERNVDVDAAIAWLQAFQYPEYSTPDGQRNPGGRPKPPRKMILTLPNVNINFGRPQVMDDEMNCILLSAEVSRESFFPSGATRLAKVELTFAEIIQVYGTVTPHDASAIRGESQSRYALGIDSANPSERRESNSATSGTVNKFIR